MICKFPLKSLISVSFSEAEKNALSTIRAPVTVPEPEYKMSLILKLGELTLK